MKLPLTQSAVIALGLDRLHAPPWVWGAVGALAAIIWIGAVVARCQQKEVDVFEAMGLRRKD